MIRLDKTEDYIMTIDQLIEDLKKHIIEELDLTDVVESDFDGDTILFGEGLELDSIDALELIVMLERNYNIKIEDPKERRSALKSTRTMAEYILEHQK